MDSGISRRAVVGGALSGAAVLTFNGCSAGERPVAARPEPPHQDGIVTPPPAATTVVALDLGPRDRADLLRLLGDLATRIAAVRGATVTVGVGAALFDDRFGLSALRPKRLTTMPGFPNDVLDAGSCHGDLLLQVCADTAKECSTVLTDLLAAGRTSPRWRIDGHRADNAASPKPTMRNPFGFREGAGNPAAGDTAEMDDLVWAGDDEPGWAAGGTYAVVRLIRLATTLWNREAVPRQEQVIGRTRSDDLPLGHTRAEDASFDYTDDPDGTRIALDAHIRRANPRTPEARKHRMLRRGYSYRKAADAGGEPDEGLIFICYQRDSELAFAAAQRRMAGEALERYVLPFGGGYFFVPPSVTALRDALAGSS